MVSIVLVSHSRALALALRDLVRQVAGNEIAIAVAAGVGPNREEFGTDAVEIMEAIQSVDNDDGVVVLMDLGSAILSAEMALDLLPVEMQDKIVFCAAPIVEGAIAAAVQAGMDSDKETVCAEARRALTPKEEQLGVRAPDLVAPESIDKTEVESGEIITLQLNNLHGLHARPAARFVQVASAFEAEIKVRNLSKNKGPVTARSLNALATLAALKHHEIEISAIGPQASEALAALKQLVEENFGEAPESVIQPLPIPSPPTSSDEGIQQGVPISEGYALAKIYILREEVPPIPTHKAQNPQQERENLQSAIEKTSQAITKQYREVVSTIGKAQAEIFQAHLYILDDPVLIERTHTAIDKDQINAAQAWKAAIDEIAESYLALEDPYLQQRAQDVLDVGTQVLNALLGKAPAGEVMLTGPVIIYAQDLTPSQTARLDLDKVQGVVTVGGGPTSHSAILARAMGIPAVAGANPEIGNASSDTWIGLDGFKGKIWVNPASKEVQDLQVKREAWLNQRARLLESKLQPAKTIDGHAVEVAANVGNLQDALEAVENGAEGIGLLRTEFLFLTRQTPPDETEQQTALADIARAVGPRPIIVRTLDVGGDKELPYIDLPREANPFLGIRAIRLSLKQPELFKTQLRSILRAAENHHFRIMFPMVSSHEELILARQILEEVHQSLSSENLPHSWPIETGIMIEVPAAAIMSPLLAFEVDFFSIGTNDLTQYTLAAERGNPALPGFADALHPSVLKLIEMVINSAHEAKKWVGVCGELAGDPVAVPVLVGLGVDELSLNPRGIPQVKYIIRNINLNEAQQLAAEVLKTPDARSARKLAAAFYQNIPKA